MIRIILCLLALIGIGRAAEDFRPQSGKFPPIAEAKSHRGELVFIDHVNRRGGLRLHIDGFYREIAPHAFAMLPYGMIYYRGAPAELRDIPIGTVMYGRFYLPPDPETSAVPVIKRAKLGVPRGNHAILLEDGPSLCLREGKAWKVAEVEINGSEGHLIAGLEREDGGEGLGGVHKISIDRSTRIWRGRELLGLDDLIADGTWPRSGKKSLKTQPANAIYFGLTWHPRYLYQQFHAADLWLDDTAMKVATERQRQVHIRHIRHRWLPAWVDAVDYGKFGDATVTVTLFGGMDESLYADFKPGVNGQMCASENTLRTYWQNHDGMEGKIESVERIKGEPPLGSSGIQIKFSMNLVLEGFRPGRIVRIRPNAWPKVKPPREEQINGLNERWPSPDMFTK
tara:strand:+ start:7202 stop:8392 length:1191 start_codon:yes stop_codon:yes gene_type:complete